MKIKIDRRTPILTQVGATPEALLAVVGVDKRSIAIEEIDIDSIYHSLYLDINHICDGADRIDYFKKRAKKFIRLDAAIGLALVRNCNSIPHGWGEDEHGNLVTSMYFDGTIFRSASAFDLVVRVSRDTETNLWDWSLSDTSGDSEHPSAIIKK